ncbi:MAG: hypothetical protein LBJ67_02385 [Planctomycetaceae bacterium]|nr:hypothetical protein [Planctomycetaceae bacterium]
MKRMLCNSYSARGIFLLVVLLAGTLGCPQKKERAANNPNTPPKTNDRHAEEVLKDVFNQSVEILNHLENHFGQESLLHLVTRLDKWGASQSPDPTWQPDPLFVDARNELNAAAKEMETFVALLQNIVETPNAAAETPNIAANGAATNPPTPLTAESVQQAADAAIALRKRFESIYQKLGSSAFFQYTQIVNETEEILAPLAKVAKSQNMNAEQIRAFFRNQFQRKSTDAAQLILAFKHLAEMFPVYAETFGGESLTFRAFDGDYLKQAFWCRGVSSWARGGRQKELDRACELFDWTVRNIMMTSVAQTQQGNNAPFLPQPVWETLVSGKGDASELTWVFIELLRQQRIDACVLGANIPPSQDAKPVQIPWGVGVLLDGKIYVFLTQFGVPLVEEKDVTLHPEKGIVFSNVATLDELQTNPDLLKPYLDAGLNPQFSEFMVKNSVLMIPANPIAQSQRMKILEKALTGNNKTVLYFTYQELKERFEKAANGRTVQLWHYPMDVNWLGSLNRGTADGRLQFLEATADPKNPRPLWKGRVIYFSGQKTGSNGAAKELQQACMSERQITSYLDALMQGRLKNFEEQMRALQIQIDNSQDEAEKNDLKQTQLLLQQEQANYMREQPSLFLFFKITTGTAHYWLGQVNFEESLASANARNRAAALNAAFDYVDKKVLQKPEADAWKHGAHYHLGRVSECLGKYDDAIKYYTVSSPEPDAVGRMFRANQLKRLTRLK